ncbi:hypothetical protein IP79_10215 [Porphyrobacter sp. AAP60]|nr:hypothetical protein IP79_10215 [Porphyrobacter sp. AAP60]
MRWLTSPGLSTPHNIRGQLLAQLLSSQLAIVMGSISGLIVGVASAARHGSAVFIILVVLEIILLSVRLLSLRSIAKASNAVRITRVDQPIWLSILWCGLQGATAFFAMRTGDTILMVLTATMVMALIGPLCARNYAAPRLALLLVALCDFPFVAGAVSTGNPWFYILVGITPMFLLGAIQIVTNYNSAMVRALTAEHRNLELSRRDPLTGLLNRGGLDSQLQILAPTRPVAIIAMDLDGFKEINDTYGHAAGDDILEQAAARMRKQVSGLYALARLGGDEFMAVLVDQTPQEVKANAEEILSAIRNKSFQLHNGFSVNIGISVGYACLPEDAQSVLKLRVYADDALYAAKHAGKGLTARYCQKMATA